MQPSILGKPVPRAVSYDHGLPWDQFTVVTAQDIPGENCVAHVDVPPVARAPSRREAHVPGTTAAGLAALPRGESEIGVGRVMRIRREWGRAFPDRRFPSLPGYRRGCHVLSL
jgi:hypothetical protein